MIPCAQELGSIDYPHWPTALAFGADGKSVIVGHFGPPEVLDLGSGKPRRTCQPLPVSPAANGVCWWIARPERDLLVAVQYNAVGVWNARGKLVTHILSRREGPNGIVSCVAVTPDGRRVLCGTLGKQLVLTDLASGEQIWCSDDKTSFAGRVAISPDGKRAVTAGSDKTVRLWDMATGKQLGLIGTHRNYVQGLAFLPDGKRVVTGSRDKTVVLWDLRAARPLLTMNAHRKEVLGVVVAAGGKRAVSAGGDGAFVWDLSSGEAVARFVAHGKTIPAVAVSPDGRSVVTASRDHKLRHWAVV